MICTNCKKRPATVHFQSITNGKGTRLDVCQECALQLALPLESVFKFPAMSPALEDLFGILAQLKPPTATVVRAACPKCKWTLAQFQKTGRMGCPECYGFFKRESQGILNKVQGQTIHKGKKLKPKEKRPSVAELKEQLTKAVKTENYELAAQLRDKIKSYED